MACVAATARPNPTMRSLGSRPGRSRRLALAVSVAIGSSAVAGACGSDSDSDGDSGASASGEMSNAAAGMSGKVLTIKDFTFSPEPLTVAEGTVINVVNEDDAPHTATARDDSFDTGELGKGESSEITLSESGEFAYQCDIHDYMQGVIRVNA
jgi:plastocyanin